MTDEELAEEYANIHTHYEVGKREDGTEYAKKVCDITIQQAFLAGLKAGRPQWHDLEKDPEDLPNEPNEKMRVNETWVYVKFYDNTYGIVDKSALKNYKGAIAWCELPTFDKE